MHLLKHSENDKCCQNRVLLLPVHHHCHQRHWADELCEPLTIACELQSTTHVCVVNNSQQQDNYNETKATNMINLSLLLHDAISVAYLHEFGKYHLYTLNYLLTFIAENHIFLAWGHSSTWKPFSHASSCRKCQRDYKDVLLSMSFLRIHHFTVTLDK